MYMSSSLSKPLAVPYYDITQQGLSDSYLKRILSKQPPPADMRSAAGSTSRRRGVQQCCGWADVPGSGSYPLYVRCAYCSGRGNGGIARVLPCPGGNVLCLWMASFIVRRSAQCIINVFKQNVLFITFCLGYSYLVFISF